MRKYKEPRFMQELHAIRRKMSKMSDKELLKRLKNNHSYFFK